MKLLGEIDLTNDDIKLLESAKNGNQDAINNILIDNKSLVAQIARKYFLLGGDQEDLIQEGMIGLFKAINIFDKNRNDNFKNFASRVVEREIISAIRKENTSKNQVLDNSVFVDSNEFLHDENYPELDLIYKENYDELKAKIFNNLSDFEKSVLEYYLKGYAYVDIAKLLSKNPKAIDNALTRIKTKVANIKEVL